MNNSSTGGYVFPIGKPQLPKKLTLDQFLQTVLVGVTGLDGTLIRPKWQPQPPAQPDLPVDWIAYAITNSVPDTYGFIGINPDGSNYTQRHETLEIGCSFYGPNALDNYYLLRDGLQLQQNCAALKSANMAMTELREAMHVPDLVNERWINRYESSLFLRREVQREYPILTFLSASGVIYADASGAIKTIDWNAQS